MTPLAIAAALGLPLLWRTGRRAEAAVCAAIPLLFLAYNAAYYLPFGGQSPGPRFLVPALPFLVLPLALLLRSGRSSSSGVGVASVAVMALATLTGPLTGVEYGIGTWLGRLGRSEIVETVVRTGRVGCRLARRGALPRCSSQWRAPSRWRASRSGRRRGPTGCCSRARSAPGCSWRDRRSGARAGGRGARHVRGRRSPCSCSASRSRPGCTLPEAAARPRCSRAPRARARRATDDGAAALVAARRNA